LYANSAGTDNTAIGNQSLYLNKASRNTAVGTFALQSNETGTLNTALGVSTLVLSKTDQNTAIGAGSSENNSSGSGNTSLGAFSLQNNSSGSFNTAIGRSAGCINGFNPSNFTAIGAGAGYVGSNSNTIEIGNTSISWIGGQVNWLTYSDARIKKNVVEDVPGIEFIMKLRPVTYNLDIHRQNEMVYGPLDSLDWEGKYDLETRKMTGFIAQEVEVAAQQCQYDFSGVRPPLDNSKLYSVSYAEFVVPLVKAMQEQQLLIEALQVEIDRLKMSMQKNK
jgi:hypothetical protein